jgi:hypothetical protein
MGAVNDLLGFPLPGNVGRSGKFQDEREEQEGKQGVNQELKGRGLLPFGALGRICGHEWWVVVA